MFPEVIIILGSVPIVTPSSLGAGTTGCGVPRPRKLPNQLDRLGDAAADDVVSCMGLLVAGRGIGWEIGGLVFDGSDI